MFFFDNGEKKNPQDLGSKFKLTLSRLFFAPDASVGLPVCVCVCVERPPCILVHCVCVCVEREHNVGVHTLVMKFHRTSMSDTDDS